MNLPDTVYREQVSEEPEPDNVAGNDHNDQEDDADFCEASPADPRRVFRSSLVRMLSAYAAGRGGGRVILVTHDISVVIVPI